MNPGRGEESRILNGWTGQFVEILFILLYVKEESKWLNLVEGPVGRRSRSKLLLHSRKLR